METIIREIGSLPLAERSLVERWVGHPLKDSQKVILSVVPPTLSDEVPTQPGIDFPQEWAVLEGITENELEILNEALADRTDGSRPTPLP